MGLLFIIILGFVVYSLMERVPLNKELAQPDSNLALFSIGVISFILIFTTDGSGYYYYQ